MHERNVFSQSGEDGILEKALGIIPSRDRWCVEFGAWDGQCYSNTCNLVQHHGYSAVLIEGNPAKMGELREFCGRFPKAIPVCAMVGWDGPNRLDALLSAAKIPADFDLLSIDIDGNDYHVWEALRDFRPKLLVVEYNPTMANEVDFVQPASPELAYGTSLTALVRLGLAKGYELVAVTKLNAIFVDRKYFPAFGIPANSPELMREDQSRVTHIFFGYDGTVFIRGYGKTPWQGVKLHEHSVQILPRWLRGWEESPTPFKKALIRCYSSLKKRDLL